MLREDVLLVQQMIIVPHQLLHNVYQIPVQAVHLQATAITFLESLSVKTANVSKKKVVAKILIAMIPHQPMSA